MLLLNRQRLGGRLRSTYKDLRFRVSAYIRWILGIRSFYILVIEWWMLAYQYHQPLIQVCIYPPTLYPNSRAIYPPITNNIALTKGRRFGCLQKDLICVSLLVLRLDTFFSRLYSRGRCTYSPKSLNDIPSNVGVEGTSTRFSSYYVSDFSAILLRDLY